MALNRLLARLLFLMFLSWAAQTAVAQTGQENQDIREAPVEGPSEVQKELARTIFETAVSKSAQGDWSEALELLVRSRALVDRPVTAFNQALVLVRLSRMREALVVLAEARALARSPEDDELLRRIEQLRVELEPMIAEVSVRVEPTEASLSVDGKSTALDSSGTYALKLDPGPHRLEASLAEHVTSSVELRVDRGERRSIALVLTQKPELRAKPSALPSPTLNLTPDKPVSAASAPPDAEPRPLWKRAAFWIPVSVVVVASVVTGVWVASAGQDSPDPSGGSSGRIFSPP